MHHLRTDDTNGKRKQCRLNAIYQSRRSVVVFIRVALRVMCNARDSYDVVVSSDYCRRRSSNRANHPGGKGLLRVRSPIRKPSRFRPI